MKRQIKKGVAAGMYGMNLFTIIMWEGILWYENTMFTFDSIIVLADNVHEHKHGWLWVMDVMHWSLHVR